MPISIKFLHETKSNPTTEEAMQWVRSNQINLSHWDNYVKLRFSFFIRETQKTYGFLQGAECVQDFQLYKAARPPTRILMSFAMAGGGMQFVQWLRNRLMIHYGLFSTDSVYVDFVSARSGDCYYGVAPVKTFPTYATIRPDERRHMLSATGARPIGAMHPQWREMFDSAMNEAEVVLFVLTEEFLNSNWCMQEVDGFRGLLERRQGLRGVVLNLYNLDWDLAAHNLRADRVTVITELKDAQHGAMLWDQGGWGISAGAFDNLVAQIGDHPQWRQG